MGSLLFHLLTGDVESLAMSPYYGGAFGLGLNPYHVHRYQRPNAFRSPSNHLVDELQMNRSAKRDSHKAVSNVGKDGFQVSMDVQQFKPSELTVKVVDDAVVVEGKHEEREDNHGYISRHFIRRYALPKNYDADKVVSALSSDGVLTVSVPKPAAIEDKSQERLVQIQQTGPAHLNVKENAQEKPNEPAPAADKPHNGGKKL